MKPDLSQAHTKAFFDQYGFALIRNVFSAEEITELRSKIGTLFATPSPHEGDWDNQQLITSLRCDLFNRYPQFREVLLKLQVREALQEVLGEVAVVPESVAHMKGYGPWHKDTTSQERAGHRFHYDPVCNMVECAVYLQDNDPLRGGGLDVVPSTHKTASDEFLIGSKKNLFGRLINRLKHRSVQSRNTNNKFTIPGQAGDFIFFNKRLNHRATPIADPANPPALDKMAIFFIAGTNNHTVNAYTDYIVSRYPHMQEYRLDPAFEEACNEQNIRLIVPSGKK